ncbi:adenylate/guanylate cyclase domain-containing protein [Leisingera thetidis]|uniref:adenylate/guanylate cyclase domain-containing protein n=1 Tax=Leisingera thetidis TaxID=2930199 RepID=UPI0021F6B724|nr:adenylate/guanylate cyclase domain-containing protein [Leisingera thetidis]
MPENRKLAAILVADIAGYSRLAGLDEDGTLAQLRVLRSDVVDPAVATHNGRVVKRTGDGALVEFRSVVEAVRCAIEIQTAMIPRNAGLPQDRRIEFRMGIHIGDVVEERDGDLMGDGVNIAARLEGIADPGGICLSEDAYRQVRARLGVPATDLGRKALKNIAEALTVYALDVGTPAGMAPRQPDATAGPAVAEKPSIAVLPFANMSGDPEQEYFADGMAEDIITALSRFEQLFIIARNSSFVYKGQAVDIKQAGQDLGVRYVLEGSVRKAGDRVRITGQLIDAGTGAHLWADKFDGRLENVFELQDQITASVVGAIEPTVRKAEIERARRKPVQHMGAYDLYLQALPHVYTVQPGENAKALDLLGRAIELDPEYAPALAHMGWCLVQRATRTWEPYSGDDTGLAVSLARRALAFGSGDAHAVVLGGFVLSMLRQDHLTGLDAVRRAVEINPGSGFVNAMAGCALIFGDDAAAGLKLLDRAMELCPKDPNFFSFLTVAAYGHFLCNRPEHAIELAQRSLARNSGWDSTYWVLIAAYAMLGRPQDAEATAARLLAICPEANVSHYRKVLPIRNPGSREMVLASLKKAGIPEG